MADRHDVVSIGGGRAAVQVIMEDLGIDFKKIVRK
jgi:hypothetical protein